MQKKFEKQGFLVADFLNADEIDYLNSFFDELHPNPQGGFVAGSYSGDLNYKKKASDEIVRVFSKHYERLFLDYQPFGGAFLYKLPLQQSELAAHQDWTIVDETKFVALNCWVPLCDITLDNGPLMILPGSHFDNLNVLRSPTLPFFFSGDEQIVMQELEPMVVKAGTAVILNQSVIHYSPANKSDKIRKAITAGVKSAGAQMYFHFKVPGKDELEVFQQDDDFLISFENFAEDIGQRPKLGKSVGFIPYQLPQYKDEELLVLIAKMKTSAGFELKSKFANVEESITATFPPRKSLFQRVASLFQN